MSKKTFQGVNMEEIENLQVEPVEDAVPVEVKPSGFRRFWRRHGTDVIVYTVQGVCAAATIWGLVHEIRQGKLFNKQLKEQCGYTDNMTEGMAIGANLKSLWENHGKWEKNNKSKFKLVKGLFENMDMEPGEYFSVNTVKDKSGSFRKEIFHMLDNGFYHDEII